MLIEISHDLELPLNDVHRAAIEIAKAAENRTPPYDAVTLAVNLRNLRTPLEGEIRIPVEIQLEPPAKMSGDFHVEIRASSNEALFPRFEGTLSLTPEGEAGTRLWLRGEYVPPMGFLGSAVDATALHGVGERSLTNFLDWIASDISTRVIAIESKVRRTRDFNR